MLLLHAELTVARLVRAELGRVLLGAEPVGLVQAQTSGLLLLLLRLSLSLSLSLVIGVKLLLLLLLLDGG